jgi:hypothetical protein
MKLSYKLNKRIFWYYSPTANQILLMAFGGRIAMPFRSRPENDLPSPTVALRFDPTGSRHSGCLGVKLDYSYGINIPLRQTPILSSSS